MTKRFIQAGLEAKHLNKRFKPNYKSKKDKIKAHEEPTAHPKDVFIIIALFFIALGLLTFGGNSHAATNTNTAGMTYTPQRVIPLDPANKTKQIYNQPNIRINCHKHEQNVESDGQGGLIIGEETHAGEAC